ncbi:AMP-binding protein [Streptomyces sp. NPDC017979]|uniref:AMP-binding protein n=1 Tax=Streptomyces sp. NPDC017979 TaxID=3365024 RepID=UPI0037A8F08D
MSGGKLHQLFEGRVRDGHDRTAVITDRDELTYGQLDARANRLAHHLLDVAHLEPGDLVAIRTLRAPDVLVAALGVLKAGGVFAIASPSRPEPKALAGARAVISNRVHSGRLTDLPDKPLILLDGHAATIEEHPADPVEAVAGPGAALLFTAGTAGQPKAVAIEHARFTAAYEAFSEVFGLLRDDRVLVTGRSDTLAFAVGWLRTLCSGATLVLTTRVPYTVADTDPTTAAALLAGPRVEGLRLMAVGGERLRLDEHLRLARRLAPGARLISVYGTTEVAGCGTWFETDQLPGPMVRPEQHAFLGQPFPGVRTKIHGKHIWLTPPDGGDAVPTGGLGQRHGTGPLEYLGKMADRFRHGGRQVNPYQIEARLVTHPDVRDVLVERSQLGQLIAYVVPEPGRPAPRLESVQAHLRGKGPASDVPSHLVGLTALPRTAAGKLDRDGLVLPAPPDAAGATRSSGKGGPVTASDVLRTVGGLMAFVAFFGSLILTDVFWPGSTDLTIVPSPWAGFFRGLYFAEHLAFAAGVGFLFAGPTLMPRTGAPRALTAAAHLSIVYLLASWWPQDNFYRLAAKQDWERQAALVYAFNVPLMLAAAVVAVWAAVQGAASRKQPSQAVLERGAGRKPGARS